MAARVYARARRRYARWFGEGRDGAIRLGAYALAHAARWEQLIERWQRPILEDKYVTIASDLPLTETHALLVSSRLSTLECGDLDANDQCQLKTKELFKRIKVLLRILK